MKLKFFRYEAGNRTRRVFAGSLGVLLGLFLVLGFCLQEYGRVLYSQPLLWVVLFLTMGILAVLSYFLLGVIFTETKEPEWCKKPRSLTIVLICAFAFIYLCWFVQLLGVYPGFFNYDAPNQWTSYAESNITAHHPYLHTYLVGWMIHFSFFAFKNSNTGCFIFVLIQMVLTDFAFVRILKFVNKKRIHLIFSIISTLYFALFPSVVINVFSITKDSTFAPFLILFVISTIEIMEIISKKEKIPVRMLVSWCVCAFFSAILRNNATYVIVPFIIVMGIFAIRKRVVKLVVSAAIVLAVLVAYYGPIQNAVTVSGVNEKEYLSVPCQQLMRVYHLHKDELGEEELSYIESAFEEEALVSYVPKIADVAKGNIVKEVFDQNPSRFFEVWFKLGVKYPAEYIDSFFLGNYGFWYPFATLTLYANGEEGYFVCRTYNPTWVESKIYTIKLYFDRISRADFICNQPLTMWAFAPATYFFIHLFTAAYLAVRKKKEAIVFIPLLLIWLTFLLGPVALVRYVSYLYYMLPLEIGLIMRSANEE